MGTYSSDRLVSVTSTGCASVVVPLELELVTTSNLELTINRRTTLADDHIRSKVFGSGKNGVVLVRGSSNTRGSLRTSVLRDELESGMSGDELGSGHDDESSGPHVGSFARVDSKSV
jgi:hypothetical protein